MNTPSHQQPPRWATRLLRFYCAPHLLEEVQGDLQEEFDYQVKKAGLASARFDYIRNVFGFIRPFAIKRKQSHTNPLTMSMLKHYLMVAFRNLMRQKSFSAINIAGLALGMTCCLFIFLWVKDEQAVDNFHSKGDRLYTIYQNTTSSGKIEASYATPLALIYQSLNIKTRDEAAGIGTEEISAAVPGIKKLCWYATGYELPWGHSETLQVGEKIQKFDGSRASKEFFTMFDYPLLAGDVNAALHDVSSMAISRKVAELFFSSPQDAIGKSIRYENKIDFVVNAVFENVTPQSSLQFDFLVNWDAQIKQLEWSSNVAMSTLLLDNTADPGDVANKLNVFLKSRLDKNDPNKITVGLQPFGERYLYSTFVNGKPEEGRIEYARIFTGIAIFILVIACINFMNLATARAMKRAKEVGVRKTIGSSRIYLIGQFFGESILLAFLSLIVSLILLILLFPSFNAITGKQIASPMGIPTYWLWLIGLMLGTGVIAGSYPALYLSSLKPVRILKGTLQFSRSAVFLRKGLVCFQFILSIGLLIATVVISRQTQYAQHKNLGYNKDNLVYLSIEGELNPKYATLKQRLEQMPGIVMVDRSSEAPHAMGFIVDDNDGYSETGTNDDAINWEGKEKGGSVGFKPTSVGFDFLNLMKMEVADGRGFSRAFATDSADAFMINEEAVKQMGIKDPIGKWISAWQKKGHIIGILKDYHTNTLHEKIKPVIVDVKEYEYFGVILVRLEEGKTTEGMASLEKICHEINPNYPFSFKFLDQEYDKLYRAEKVITWLSNVFAVFGVLISCLGLLGLVMLASEQRTKEIGIRKVLGASVASILRLISVEFLVLILISFCIAAPITGYLMNQWLLTFEYKIDLSWWIFVASGVAAMLVALLTIVVQAYRSATRNSVESLRAE